MSEAWQYDDAIEAWEDDPFDSEPAAILGDIEAVRDVG